MNASRIGRRGFTLIELLIVIAIMSIMSSGFIGIHVHMMRERKKIRVEMDAAADEYQVLGAVLRDLANARSIKIPPDGGAAIRLEQRGSNDAVSSGTISYVLEGPRLSRRIDDPTTTHTLSARTQTLSSRMQTFEVERRGALLRVAVACRRDPPGKNPAEPLETECFTGGIAP